MNKIIFSILCISLLSLGTLSVSLAQTELTNINQLETVDFILSDPQPIYEGQQQIGTVCAANCFWKQKIKKCRGGNGVCSQGHITVDMDGVIQETALQVPGEEGGLTRGEFDVKILSGTDGEGEYVEYEER